MVLAIRRHATRVRFDHLSVETTEAGGVTKVLLEEPTGLPREAEWTLVPFPNIPKDLDEDIQEGIMMRGACTEAHSYLEDWVKLLLLGKSIWPPYHKNTSIYPVINVFIKLIF